MELSDYKARGFASLHIKTDTRQRLNLVKAQMQAREGKFVSQDDLINRLLDMVTAKAQPHEIPQN